MSALEGLHINMGQFAETVQHGAAWLVGAYNIATADIAEAEAESPLVKEAVDMSLTWARGKGVPVDDVPRIAACVLALAKTVAAAPPPAAQELTGGADNEHG